MTNVNMITTKMFNNVIWSVKIVSSQDIQKAAINADGLVVTDEFLGIAEQFFGTSYDENDGEYIYPAEHLSCGYLYEFQQAVLKHIDENFTVLLRQQIG